MLLARAAACLMGKYAFVDQAVRVGRLRVRVRSGYAGVGCLWL